MKLSRNILRLLRPRQWVKNLAIFAALLFSGRIFFNITALERDIFGFFIFCALSSSIYIINDMYDIEKDRLHPFKKFRPLANNEVPLNLAAGLAILLSLVPLLLSYFINAGFFLLAFVYLLLHLSYSAFLKQIEIVDIMTLATGYILRVYAGEVVSSYHISAWLLISTISVSLFLAIGKRRSELTLLAQYSRTQLTNTRKTLTHYSERLLDIYLTIFATLTFISYSLYTFLENPTGSRLSTDLIPANILGTYLQKKWLMLTIIPVVYGIMRYLQRIYEYHEGESPERVLFSDRPLLASVVVWVVLVVIVIYYIK